MSSNLTMMSGPVLKAPKFAATGTVQGLKDAGPGPGKPVIVDWSQIQNKPTLGAQFQQLQLVEAPDDGAYIVGVMLIAGVPTGIRVAYPSAKTIAEAVIAAGEAVAAAEAAAVSQASALNSKLEAAASAAAAQLSEDNAAASATAAAGSAASAAATVAALAGPTGSTLLGFKLDGSTYLLTADDLFRQHLPLINFMSPAQRADINAKSGAVDMSAAIQAGMTYSSQAQGISIYQAPGPYLINSALTLKYGASFIGSDTPRQGNPGNFINDKPMVSGAQWRTNVGVGTTTGQLVKAETASKLANVNIWYTGQYGPGSCFATDNPADIKQYPPTIVVGQDTTGGNSDNVVIENISALNCYEFMQIGDGANPVGRTIVENVFANPLSKGITIRSRDGDLPMLRKVFIENLFTTGTGLTPNLYNWLRANATAFDIGYAQGVNITDCIALSYGYGLKVNSQTWAQIVNFLADYCSVPFQADGADRVHVSNSMFINNVKPGGPSAYISTGAINALTFTNCTFGDYYSGVKTGVFAKHASGLVEVSNSKFRTAFPAVLNTGAGTVSVSNCGIGYDQVVGKGVSVDGGPVLASGASLGLTNINPTSPAATGWTYTTPGNVTAITNGIRVQGAGNNTLNYRPATISGANNDKIYWGTQLNVLEFDLKIQNQAGSPRLEILILNDSLAVSGQPFQLCSDASTANSALPEGETFHVALIFPWTPYATQFRFNLPSQTASTLYEITNMDINAMAVPLGRTGLEFLGSITNPLYMPAGFFDAATGKRIARFESAPTAGTWAVGDRIIKLTPTVGQPKAWICTVAGTPGTWVSEGNL